MKALLLALVVVEATGFSPEGLPADAKENAVVRLSPDALPRLPVAIRKDLTSRGCTIPQVGGEARIGNVIQGRFQVPDRTDWAVLCSAGGISRILFYKGGATANVYEMPESAQSDGNWIQDGVGYSRTIRTAGAARIRHLEGNSGGLRLRPIDHDGLEEAFVEKGSVIHYWRNGSWLRLQGGD